MKSDHIEGGLPSNLELTGNRLLLDRTLVWNWRTADIHLKTISVLLMVDKRKYVHVIKINNH